MASIMTAQEQSHLANMIKGTPYAWLGGGRVMKNWFFWFRHKSNAPYLLEPVVWQNFEAGEPGYPDSQLVMLENGLWHDWSGVESQRAFCELRC